MKSLTPCGMGDVLGDQPTLRRCLMRKNQRETLAIENEVDLKEEKPKPSQVEYLVEVEVDESDEKVRI